MTNSPKVPRGGLRPDPRLRHSHLEPLICRCPDDCPVPHDVWLMDGNTSKEGK